ncbi:MAG TPA: helix-turn-helix domain-containing protein [Vicinamibacterales bacterium]|nr:helix-turn-helix domain-containing protein [Vicinamibacterales bacterium]
MEKRRVAATATRARILEATRQLLAEQGTSDLSMDAIARRADVARLTIYYQFKSRRGLLEALYDYLAMRGNMQRMAEVFHAPDPEQAIERLVRTFVGFWSSDPLVMRRLRAMASLDGEVEQGIRARDARRQHASREILRRMSAAAGASQVVSDKTTTAAANLLSALTSFETYDALAVAGHSQDEIIGMITTLAKSAVTTPAESVPLRAQAKTPVRRRPGRKR